MIHPTTRRISAPTTSPEELRFGIGLPPWTADNPGVFIAVKCLNA
jgi:hypothetical protein